MSRQLRIEFPGAVYHVTSRGDRREPIYRNDTDRQAQIDILAQAMDRFDAQVLAYCQMGNHFHLVLHTRSANLSRLMRHFNGVYTQAFNRRHGVVGHLFQGRFKAILVDRDSYLLALCRYVERNPVAAGLVARPADWAWSSCQAHLGQVTAPGWLDGQGLYGQLLGRPVASDADTHLAVQLYADLVDAGSADDGNFWQAGLRGQVYLGDEGFVRQVQQLASPKQLSTTAFPRVQRGLPQVRPAIPLSNWQACLAACDGKRNDALVLAYREGGFTMPELAVLADISVSQVGRVIARAERERMGET